MLPIVLEIFAGLLIRRILQVQVLVLQITTQEVQIEVRRLIQKNSQVLVRLTLVDQSLIIVLSQEEDNIKEW